MTIHAFTVHHDEINLAAQRFESSGDPLLLIHGIGAEMLYWHDGFCEALVGRGFEVARFDNRDSGESTHLHASGTPKARRVRRDPNVAPYRLEDMADDAAAVLDSLDWPTAHVVGHSLGGMIAQLLAARHPARVRSLTSISASVDPYAGRMKRTTILRLVRANPADFLGRAATGPDEAAERLIRGHRILGSPDYPLDEAWLAGIAKMRFARGHDSGARARHVAAGWASGDLRPTIAGIAAPTLVIHGEEDPLVRLEGGRATAAAIPDATLVTYAGMGHDLPEQLWPKLVDRIRAHADKAEAIA